MTHVFYLFFDSQSERERVCTLLIIIPMSWWWTAPLANFTTAVQQLHWRQVTTRWRTSLSPNRTSATDGSQTFMECFFFFLLFFLPCKARHYPALSPSLTALVWSTESRVRYIYLGDAVSLQLRLLQRFYQANWQMGGKNKLGARFELVPLQSGTSAPPVDVEAP